MATVTPQTISSTEVTVTYAAVVGPDSFTWFPGCRLRFRNTNAAARNVTVASKVVDGVGYAHADKVINVPLTTGDKEWLVAEAYKDPTTGLVTLTYDATANLTVAVTN